MTPRQLRYFVEIARAGSVSVASGTLRIAQPALSQHMALLEQELDATLFERHAKGVRLTAQGSRLLDRAASILAQLGGLKEDICASAEHARGPVRLCIAGSLAMVLAAPLFRYLEQHHPDVRLVLSTGLSSEVRALVESRQLDLALMPNAFELPNLSCTPIYQERFHLFGLNKLLGDSAAPIRFADIGVRPLVAPDRDHDLRRLVERTAIETSAPLNVKYEVNNPELGFALVRDGLACAILPQSVLVDANRRRVGSREIVKPALSRVQSIVRVTSQAFNPACEAVAQAVATVTQTLIRKKLLHGVFVQPVT